MRQYNIHYFHSLGLRNKQTLATRLTDTDVMFIMTLVVSMAKRFDGYCADTNVNAVARVCARAQCVRVCSTFVCVSTQTFSRQCFTFVYVGTAASTGWASATRMSV